MSTNWTDEPLTIEGLRKTINEARQKILSDDFRETYAPQPYQSVLMDHLTVSPTVFRSFPVCQPPRSNPLHSGYLGGLLGIPMRESSLFPFEHGCSACGTTGEGETSTYCDKCGGAGEIRVVGVAQDRRHTTLLTEKIAIKAFAPYFPAGLVPPPTLKGLV